MIAPRVMLTAGHCVEGNDQINDVTYVRFEEDALSGRVNYDTTLDWLNEEWMAVETVIPHPQYSDFAEFPQTYDVGVVILAESYYPANGFATLPSLGFLEEVRGRDRLNFEAVGYGRQGTLAPFRDESLRAVQGRRGAARGEQLDQRRPERQVLQQPGHRRRSPVGCGDYRGWWEGGKSVFRRTLPRRFHALFTSMIARARCGWCEGRGSS
jgi:hypothetical protein